MKSLFRKPDFSRQWTIGTLTYTFSGMMSKDDKLETTLEILTLAGGPAFKIEGNKVYMSKNKSRL